jgi:hypothetical protein
MNTRFLIKYNTLIMQCLIGSSFFKAMFFEYDKILLGRYLVFRENKLLL